MDRPSQGEASVSIGSVMRGIFVLISKLCKVSVEDLGSAISPKGARSSAASDLLLRSISTGAPSIVRYTKIQMAYGSS